MHFVKVQHILLWNAFQTDGGIFASSYLHSSCAQPKEFHFSCSV